MTRDDVNRWLARYIDAWRTYLRFAPSGDPDVPAIGQAIANLEAVKR